jgi:pimeloyl-ACP methyl ester carboxylesterase
MSDSVDRRRRLISARPYRAWQPRPLRKPINRGLRRGALSSTGWSRCAASMPASSTSPITKRDRRWAGAILLHGFPYDIHIYVDVAPQLAAQGCRVIVPYLRGFGATRFSRSCDLALGRAGGDRRRCHRADGRASRASAPCLAGHNWGGRAACVAAALWPERCAGLVTVNSYLIQDVSRAMVADQSAT